MGVVYKAVDPNIGRVVALKTMRLDVHGIEEAEMLKRFKHEAVLAGVMNHPNVITIYDAGDWEGVFYMAMEFMEGKTLQVTLHEQHVVSVDQMLSIARQVCAGLDFAHQRGVIHRDIKPANVMLSADGTAKIMDFGIAKSGSNMTTAGQVLGTPSYMSPEQVRGRNLDGRSDLFSFGVCMYEMVTGEKPFTGQNITTIIYKIMNEAPIPPRELDVSIHPGISAIITKALEKSPDERYQCGADLVRDLENYKSYGSTAPPTKVMSAAAAEGAVASGSRAAVATPHDLESVTTSHIAPDQVEEAVNTPPQPVNVVSRTGSTVRRAVGKIASPPQGRRRFAGVIASVLAFVLLAAGAVKLMRAKTAPSAETAQSTSTAPAGSTAQPPAPDPNAAKPSAAKAAPTDKASAAKGAANGVTAEDTVRNTSVPATTGEARIASTPAGARITIGGASQAKWVTPYTLSQLQPGKYDVSVAKAGYASQTKEITVSAGKQASIGFELVQAGATINVTSEPPGGMIYLDGKATGKMTPAILNVDKGKHNIEVRKAGFGEENTNVNLSDGETYSFAPALVSKNASAQQRAEQRERRGGFFSKIFGGGQKIPAGKGMLVVRSAPAGAIVMHNGKPTQGITPLRVPMDPGNYSVTLHLDGYKNAQQTFNIAPGKTTELSVPLEKK
jgi:serine/threonine-protein kinase